MASVTEQHDKILIVASAPDAKEVFEPIEGWTVIAVNQSIDFTREHTDYWFTLDASTANMKIMREYPHHYTNCKFYAAVDKQFFQKNRRNTPNKVNYLERITGNGLLGLKHGLNGNPEKINTGNSAYGALGLAYHMKPIHIALLGVWGDNKNRHKFDGLVCRDLSHLPELFASSTKALDNRGIKVLNCSSQSKIDCFEKIDFEDLKYVWQI